MKRRLEARLAGIQRELDMNPTSNLIRLEAHLQSKFRDVLKQEEILWF